MSLITVKAMIKQDVRISKLRRSHTEAGRHTSHKIILTANGCSWVPRPRIRSVQFRLDSPRTPARPGRGDGGRRACRYCGGALPPGKRADALDGPPLGSARPAPK
jgi:hypothetical protein